MAVRSCWGSGVFPTGLPTIDWPAWAQAVGSIAAILVAVALARGEARTRKCESDAELRRFYGPLDDALCHLKMCLGLMRDEEDDPQFIAIILRGLHGRRGELAKYQHVPINLWPHVSLSMLTDSIIDHLDRVNTFMPEAKINIDAPFPGGGAGLLEHLIFLIDQARRGIRAVMPRPSLGDYFAERWKDYQLDRAWDRFEKEMGDEELPRLRVRPKLIRAAMRMTWGEEPELTVSPGTSPAKRRKAGP